MEDNNSDKGIHSMRFIYLIIGLSLIACANKQTYDGLQVSNTLECEKLPNSQRQDCLNKTNINYEEYKRSRDEILNESE